MLNQRKVNRCIEKITACSSTPTIKESNASMQLMQI